MSSPPRLEEARDSYLRSTELSAEAAQRLEQRLRPRKGPRRAPWLLAGGLLAAAAAVWLLWPGSPPPPAERPLAGALLQDVALSFSGEGRLGGTEQAPVIEWESGALSVEVTPHRGVDLTVSTPEAQVRVVGTVFLVDRAEQATRVEVQRGKVEVTCVGEASVALHAGESVTCQPVDLQARVSRAVSLAQRGAPPEERLAAIDSALALADGADALISDLLAHRVRALADAGRTSEALAAAERALAMPLSARQPELAAFVARATFEERGCEAASVLERALALDPGAPEGLLLAACLVERDPERARALLHQSAPRATGELQEVARRLEQQLGPTP
jgi:hypothetical protein